MVGLTVSHEETDLSAMLRAGACGYVLKPHGHDELPRAISAAIRGEAWLTPQMTSKLVASYLASPPVAVSDALEGERRSDAEGASGAGLRRARAD